MSAIDVEIRDLSKRYGAVVALEPTTLDVGRGEFLTLLGPSGSGKTTLLMMIAGLTPPSSGRIVVGGRDITALPAHRRDIGVVFQNYALFPHLTVFENVAFPLRMRKMPEREVRTAVGRALELVRLPRLAERRPRELSGGQQQRVAFARAIVFAPRIVLMDEPLGALDKKLRDELKLEIRKLHREIGATIVYVTHDQEEAMLLSDRICLMNHARIAQIDSPALLYARPISRFAADFVGDSNILEAQVVETQAGRAILAAAGLRFVTSHVERVAGRAAVPMLIRPERIALGAADDAPNRFPGTVESTIELGGTRLILVKAGDAVLKVAAMSTARSRVEAGAAVTLAIAADDVVPLPEG